MSVLLAHCMEDHLTRHWCHNMTRNRTGDQTRQSVDGGEGGGSVCGFYCDRQQPRHWLLLQWCCLHRIRLGYRTHPHVEVGGGGRSCGCGCRHLSSAVAVAVAAVVEEEVEGWIAQHANGIPVEERQSGRTMDPGACAEPVRRSPEGVSIRGALRHGC